MTIFIRNTERLIKLVASDEMERATIDDAFMSAAAGFPHIMRHRWRVQYEKRNDSTHMTMKHSSMDKERIDGFIEAFATELRAMGHAVIVE